MTPFSSPEERAKGAERACGEKVVQKGVLGPLSFALKHLKALECVEKILLSFVAFGTTVSPHDAVSAPLVHPHQSSQRCALGS